MTAQPAISLSVAIVSYHTPVSLLTASLSSLKRALLALRKNNAADVSLYLVDNSETGSLTLEALEPALAGLRAQGVEPVLLQGHGNPGYGAGHNRALTASTAEYHLMMNPDVELDESALVAGLDFLRSHPDAVLASPAARDEAGRRQHLCKRYPPVFTFFLRGFCPGWVQRRFDRRLARFEMRDLPPDRPSSPVPIASGCFMLCRREALAALGGFDEAYFLSFEDFDLSLRLGRVGHLAHVPAMVIVHHGGNSARKGWRHVRLFVRSGLRFFNTHGWRWL